jgi:hypothetical protein
MLTGAAITVSINGAEPLPCTFSVHHERIDVSSLTASKPDMSWTFVDSQGHFHAYDHEGKLPTITRREEFVPYTFHGDEDQDEDEPDGYSEIHIECGICGEKVEPKRLPDDPHKTIPGRTEYKVTVTGELPEGRCSVLVNTPGRLWFGFGWGYLARVEPSWNGALPISTYEITCGPMSWRPAPQPPKPERDVWAGLRERTEEEVRGG